MAGECIVENVGAIDPDGTIGQEIARCWMEVANAGGAVGFPFTPIDIATAQKAVRILASDVEAGRRDVIGARIDSELVGWVSLGFNPTPLTAHWAKIRHLQSHPSRRDQGVGAALLSGAVQHARTLGLEQLILTVRGGENLEPFYEHHGWQEIGRHAGALRFAGTDDRDEVLMALPL